MTKDSQNEPGPLELATTMELIDELTRRTDVLAMYYETAGAHGYRTCGTPLNIIGAVKLLHMHSDALAIEILDSIPPREGGLEYDDPEDDD